MKLLIIEGLDRCGKDTLINKLTDGCPHIVKSHFGFPKGDTIEEKADYQVKSFNQEFAIQKSIRQTYGEHYFSDGLYVWNRSHIGEYVYGPMYRGTSTDWIAQLEHMYFTDDSEVYLILLYADPEFLIKNDDGNSFSAEIEKKTQEVEKFLQAFHESIIPNKLLLKVNNGKDYIAQETLTYRVQKFIES
jgi:thymidylate kinase